VAKAGVVHLTRCAALEFARDRIRVNCIAPGAISTPILFGISGDNKEEVDSVLAKFQAYPHVGQPEDIANAALFLASDAAAFITGHTLVVDGGATAGPKVSAPKPGRNRKSRFAGPSFG
jgi:NAD(P)-dependent dehydrogenase (short-subunit alcohol dehydrogenase family)